MMPFLPLCETLWRLDNRQYYTIVLSIKRLHVKLRSIRRAMLLVILHLRDERAKIEVFCASEPGIDEALISIWTVDIINGKCVSGIGRLCRATLENLVRESH